MDRKKDICDLYGINATQLDIKIACVQSITEAKDLSIILDCLCQADLTITKAVQIFFDMKSCATVTNPDEISTTLVDGYLRILLSLLKHNSNLFNYIPSEINSICLEYYHSCFGVVSNNLTLSGSYNSIVTKTGNSGWNCSIYGNDWIKYTKNTVIKWQFKYHKSATVDIDDIEYQTALRLSWLGYSIEHCIYALRENWHNASNALDWLCSNPEGDGLRLIYIGIITDKHSINIEQPYFNKPNSYNDKSILKFKDNDIINLIVDFNDERIYWYKNNTKHNRTAVFIREQHCNKDMQFNFAISMYSKGDSISFVDRSIVKS